MEVGKLNKRDYFIRDNILGISCNKITKDKNIIILWKNDSVIATMVLGYNKLKYNFMNKDTIFFKIV